MSNIFSVGHFTPVYQKNETCFATLNERAAASITTSELEADARSATMGENISSDDGTTVAERGVVLFNIKMK